ncbi:MAG: hypothetical protein JWO68_4296 [Actinomycetia bacterium]|nr:hypothetical protein [Actinomycetes bacterium]
MEYIYLPKLCESYLQDFESIGQTNTDPVDVFCYRHDLEYQKNLLLEMEAFLQEVEAGTKNAEDLNRMGIEYNQALGGSWDWFRDAIAYLKKKIAEG